MTIFSNFHKIIDNFSLQPATSSTTKCCSIIVYIFLSTKISSSLYVTKYRVSSITISSHGHHVTVISGNNYQGVIVRRHVHCFLDSFIQSQSVMKCQISVAVVVCVICKRENVNFLNSHERWNIRYYLYCVKLLAIFIQVTPFHK